jgi:D-sedoheptulose 7-phosphate isomerase
MNEYISNYITQQKATLDSIPVAEVTKLIERFHLALKEDRQIFVFGNGGSAANASHFITDLGKGASDKTSKRFRCQSLNDNVSWMTAIGNDYSYEDIFMRQLQNHARPGDIVLTMSVSGNSPNLVKAIDWARQNNIYTVSLLSAKKGLLFDKSEFKIVINDTHYGRVEDAHMGILHMICYAFMETPSLQKV